MEQLGLQIRQYTPPLGQLAFWWLRQSGFVFKIGEKTLYIDPFFSNISARVTPPLLSPEEASGADYILGTHDHIDHIDREAWPCLAKAAPKAKFVVPYVCYETMCNELAIAQERFIAVGATKPYEEDGLQISALPSAHELLQQDPATGEFPALGYVIRYQGFTLYHAGDCCIYEGLETRLKQLGKIDVMMLPISGRSPDRLRANIIGNMTYQEAVDLAGAVQPGLVLPMHYDSYSGNLENPLLFLEYLHVKYPQINCVIPPAGQRIDIAL